MDKSLALTTTNSRVGKVRAGSWSSFGTESPYHGASFRREALRTWFPSRGSADRDTVMSLETLRNRTRDLVRNVPIAQAAVLTMTTNVVGTGIQVRPRINADLLGITQDEAEKWENTAREMFGMWASSRYADAERKNTFYQLQILALRTMLVAGNCFALTPFRYTPASPWGLTVKLLDGERCMNPLGQLDTEQIAGGVEVDEYGAPVAYHFATRPPNGMMGDNLIVPTVRVPAFGDVSGRPIVLHLFKPDRPDQRLGVPWLSPVIEAIKQMGRYQDAEIMAAVVSGMFTVFVKTKAGTTDWDGNVPGYQREAASISADRGEMGLKGGAVVDLAEGEEIQTADPTRPNPNYEPFVNAIFREVGAGLGLPYEMISKFFSSSYTAARAAMLEGWKTLLLERANLISDFCQPVYENFVTECVSLGILQAPGYFESALARNLWTGAVWVGMAPGLLDPLKETQAAKMQVDEQFKDRTTATMEINGGSYAHNVKGLAREKAMREALGVPEPGGVQKTESISVQGIADPTTEGNLQENMD